MPFFDECSNFTFVNLTAHRNLPDVVLDVLSLKHVEKALVRFLQPLTGGEADCLRLHPPARTSFLALNFPEPSLFDSKVIDAVTQGVDAIELRVDALKPTGSSSGGFFTTGGQRSPGSPDPSFVAAQIAHLRESSPLPIIYTVRTRSHNGAFALTDSNMEEYVELLELGFRLGCEYVDVECTLPDNVLQHMLGLRGAGTQVIVSWHDYSGAVGWQSEEMEQHYSKAAQLGADVVKLVSKAHTIYDNFTMLQFQAKQMDAGGPPLMALNVGKEGQMSRFLNPVLTPVTHPLLPGQAAPGQITLQQTQQALYLAGITDKKTIYIVEPDLCETLDLTTLLRTGFELLGLPHRAVTPLVPMSLSTLISIPTFGGALGSFDPPQDGSSTRRATMAATADIILPDVDPIAMPSGSASAIWDNLQAVAIANVVQESLSPINAIGRRATALVVGGKGRVGRQVFQALLDLRVSRVIALDCDQLSRSASGTTSPANGAASPMSPQIQRISSLS